jgi:signal transduction histidine kinase
MAMDTFTLQTDIDKELETAGLIAFKKIFEKTLNSPSIGLIIASGKGEIKKHSPKAAMILTGHSGNLCGHYLSTYLDDPEGRLEHVIKDPPEEIDDRPMTFPSNVFPTHTIRIIPEIISAPELQNHSILILQNITYETTIIHEFQKLEKSLRNSNLEFKEINAQKDKFLYIIAHDLRSPLNNLMSFLEILNTQFKNHTPEENMQLIQLLGSNAHSMYELVEKFLNWALSQSGKMKHYPTTLQQHKLIKRVMNQINPVAASKNIAIRSHVPKDVTVFADETMLTTILRNLLSNAIKFSPPGSEVIISHTSENQKTIITVTDFGTGIAPDVLSRLFLPSDSITTPGTYGESGTGFGLPLCYELTKIQNGHIWVDSEPGKGSSFHVSLPRVSDDY